MEESDKNNAPAKRHQPTKKERNLLKRQQRETGRLRYHRQKKFKKVLLVAAVALIVGGGIFGGGWFLATRPPLPESEIISKQGIHWHTELSITILGQKQDIPANIGLGATERPIHTHEADNIIHFEFTGLVKKDDIRLGRFFEIWGKNFSQDCIFTKCNGPEGSVKILVNGEPNFEFENYSMRDNDKIEILFE